MGTRADFYVGRGKDAEWLGSIAWDGHAPGDAVIEAKDEAAYRQAVATMLAGRDDGTKPEDGWPWPWEDSGTTDYAFAFDGGNVWASCFGRTWRDATTEPPEDEEDGREEAVFPDMSGRKAVTYGARSGVIVVKLP